MPLTTMQLDWPQSLMSFFFSKTDNLSKITIYKLYLEEEILGLDIREDRIFAAASPTLYYHIEPKFYVNFRQSEVFLNCNIHHTS